MGIIENSSNLVRGNASLSTQVSSNTDIATGAISESHTTQFSSNVQMNEGNITRVLNSDNLSDEAKIALIEKYFGTQSAPETQQVTSKTFGSTTIVGNSKKIHANASVERNERDYWLKYLTPTHWFTVALSGVATWMASSTSGQVTVFVIKLLAGIIIILFIRDIFLKICRLVKRLLNRWKKRLRRLIYLLEEFAYNSQVVFGIMSFF